jgi:hypothetical protein
MYYLCLFLPRKIVVEGAKVTSAIWGAYDQYIITGHEDGTVAKYDILKVVNTVHVCLLFRTHELATVEAWSDNVKQRED